MRPLLLVPVMAFAMAPQRPEQPAPKQPQVNLNVVVVDSKGQSVTGLTPSDFRVTDNGKPQAIASFRRRESPPASATALGPRQYSNRAGDKLQHATVILFDQLNTQFADRGYVLNQLIHSLQQFESASNLYLYLITTTGNLYPVHGLPESGDEAAADGSWTRDIQARLNEAVKVTLAHRPIDLLADIDARIRTTYATLSIVAARLAAVPGRKNIVWLTHGIPIALRPDVSVTGDWVDYTPWVRELSNTLDRADVSIYAVQQSPPGSLTSQQADASATGATPPLRGRGASGSQSQDPAFTGLGSEETLDQFATLTGGRAYENNDIGGAIKQAINDARQSYLLSYTPPPENWDGKFHKIRVTCTRKGFRVQTRQGYFAFAEQGFSGKQEADAVDAAMQSPFDAAEIGLRASAEERPGNPPALHFTIHIDCNDVALTSSGGAFTGRLTALFVEYQDDGTMRQSKPARLDLHFTSAEHDQVMKDGIPLNESLAIAPHVEKIRAIVFDPATGALGSLSIPVGK